MERITRYPWPGPAPVVILTAEDLAARPAYSPVPNDRPSSARIHADAVERRYYQNTRATSSRLAGELRSEFDSVRRAALLRLIRRLGYETAREIWRHETVTKTSDAPSGWRFRHGCLMAAGAVLARQRDE